MYHIAMRFTRLLERAELPWYRLLRGDPSVNAVQTDSRRCGRGSCFVAVRGTQDDGHRYIPRAVEAGAAAVVCQDASQVPDDIAAATVDDTRRAAGLLAHAIRGWAVRKLLTIGVTGTNGKTTVVHLIRQILLEAGYLPGLLGTIGYQIGPRTVPARTTTPGPVDLAEMTAEMVRIGCTHLVMEVSSHALDQQRTAGLDFRVGVFTNLTGDHLDYHKTMDRYRSAKLRMFENLRPDAAAVLNRDDPSGDAFAATARSRILWFGLSPAADVWAKIEGIHAGGTSFVLMSDGKEAPIRTALIGRHNVHNCLAAAATAIELGIDLETIAEAIGSVARVPGRLQRVLAEAPFDVFVDYAHTDDALTNVLGSVRPLTEGRIILVFGCGGERDKSKRPRMAKVAGELADRIVITSDNPRREDPQAIIDEIVSGLNDSGRGRSEIEPDRREAIRRAIDQAEAGDLVLIAGKGHETTQTIGTERFPFDDVQVAEELISLRQGAS